MFAEVWQEFSTVLVAILGTVTALVTALGSYYVYLHGKKPPRVPPDPTPPPPDPTPPPPDPTPPQPEAPNALWHPSVHAASPPTMPEQPVAARWYVRPPGVGDDNTWRWAEPLPAIPGTPVRSAIAGTWWQRQQPDVEHEADNESTHAAGRSGA